MSFAHFSICFMCVCVCILCIFIMCFNNLICYALSFCLLCDLFEIEDFDCKGIELIFFICLLLFLSCLENCLTHVSNIFIYILKCLKFWVLYWNFCNSPYMWCEVLSNFFSRWICMYPNIPRFLCLLNHSFFPHWFVVIPKSYIKIPYLCGSISEFYILFLWLNY